MIIEVKDKSSGHIQILKPSLKDLLLLLPVERHSLVWSILDAEVIRKDNSTLHIGEFQEQIDNNAQGFVLEWDSLIELADAFFQEINIIVVGCLDRKLIPCLGTDEDYYSPCEIVIEGIDTTLWQIYARNASDLDVLRQHYNDITVVEE